MLSSVLTLVTLCFILTTLLIYAYSKWHVEENPLYQLVDELLPQVNCGACGYPGCRAFAEALVNKKVLPGQCTVSSANVHEKIAEILSVDVGRFEKKVARLACAGGDNVAKKQAVYSGLDSCRAAALVAGGANSCAWGCLGFGDCAKVCQFNALSMSENHLPVVDEIKCTACNDCVEICPKDLFSLHPISHRLWVTCNNRDIGDELLMNCEVACTACGRCAHDAVEDLITMRDNLPVIDYSRNHHTQLPIKHCPTGAIVWLAENGDVIKGQDAKVIIRKSAKKVSFS